MVAVPTPARLGQGIRQVLSGRTVIVAGCVVAVGLLALVPLYHLFRDTFTGTEGTFSTGAFSRAYGGNSQSGTMIRNSLEFAIGSAGSRWCWAPRWPTSRYAPTPRSRGCSSPPPSSR